MVSRTLQKKKNNIPTSYPHIEKLFLLVFHSCILLTEGEKKTSEALFKNKFQ